MGSLTNYFVVLFMILVATLSTSGNAMAYDPISEIKDRKLSIAKTQLDQLVEFRNSEKFTELPGYGTKEEQEHLSKVFNQLLDELISGIKSNPTKLWVMKQFQVALKKLS